MMEVKIITAIGNMTLMVTEERVKTLLDTAIELQNEEIKEDWMKRLDQPAKPPVKAYVEPDQEETEESQAPEPTMDERKKEPPRFSKIMNHDDGYIGFVKIKCDHCGMIRSTSLRKRTKIFRCSCGELTRLHDLRPLYTDCRTCGKHFKYLTNLEDEELTVECLECKRPVKIRLNNRKTAYVTVR